MAVLQQIRLFFPRDKGTSTAANWRAVISFQDCRLLSSPLEYWERPRHRRNLIVSSSQQSALSVSTDNSAALLSGCRVPQTDGRNNCRYAEHHLLLVAVSRRSVRWIRATKRRTDIGKYSFVNRSITDWKQLPEVAIGTSHGKTHIFKTRFRKVKTSEGKWRR